MMALMTPYKMTLNSMMEGATAKEALLGRVHCWPVDSHRFAIWWIVEGIEAVSRGWMSV